MLSVLEAQKKLLENADLLDNEKLDLNSVSRRVLTEDVLSPISHPLFDQSAVDGYAFRYNSINNTHHSNKVLKIIGEVKAGDNPQYVIHENETARIFTGAKVPDGCDTIIMQEDVDKLDDAISIKTFPDKGANVRQKGKQIGQGEVALTGGSKLNPASIGFLTSLGIKSVIVSRLPNVAIIITGNEFNKEAGRLNEGQIYESNGVMLKTALEEMNVKVRISYCEDDIEKLYSIVHSEVESNDIIIITGGVSVGDYDFTRNVLEKIDFNIIFHKVFQKPGMPLLFAKKGKTAAFGLPGNPRSVLVCFYEYVYPFIEACMGNIQPFLRKLFLPLSFGYEKKDKKCLFLNSRIVKNEVVILEGQDSHMLKSFSDADALVYLPEEMKKYNKGDAVEAHLLPK